MKSKATKNRIKYTQQQFLFQTILNEDTIINNQNIPFLSILTTKLC